MSATPQTPTSTELYARYRDHQCQESFTQLYERHNKLVVGWLRKKFKLREEAAEEAAQETWLVVFRKASNFHGEHENSFVAWLMAIARFEALATIAEQKHQDGVQRKRVLEMTFLADQLAALTARERLIYKLRHIVEFDLDQIALTVDMQPGKVGEILEHLKQKMAKIVARAA